MLFFRVVPGLGPEGIALRRTFLIVGIRAAGIIGQRSTFCSGSEEQGEA